MSTSPGAEPEELFAAWVEAREAGESEGFEVWLAAHPAHSEPLRRMHSDWCLFAPILQRVVPGSISAHDALPLPAVSTDQTPSEPLSPELIERLGIQLPDAGRYRFRGVLGRGGGGVVLRVWDTKLQRVLAMKVVLGRGELRPSGDTPPVDAATLTRFVDEARIASQLDHPGIVPVHELGTDATGRAFFTMRLVRGEDLGRIFERARRGEPEWTRERLVGVLVRVCEAVGYAHGNGVLHRDLKPANVMLGRHGEVHVMDWGLARTASVPATQVSGVQTVRAEERETSPDSPFLTTFGAAVGTPAYMAPEQARGQLERVDARADVYAIGAMLYELLAGEAPFVPHGAALNPGLVLMRVVEGPPTPLEKAASGAPEELVAITERAMAREPERRYPDVRSLEADLRAYLEGRVVAAYESGTWAETRKWMRRNRTLAGALAALLVALSIGVLVARHYQGKAEVRASEAERLLYRASIAAAEGARSQNDFRSMRRFLDEAPADARNAEWQLLDALSDEAVVVLEGQGGRLFSARFSPDGAHIVTVSDDGRARIWDAEGGRCLRVLGEESERIRDAEFSPDGRSIATISDDGALRFWDVDTWTSTPVAREAPGTDGRVQLTFVQGGRALLVESRAGIEVWDIESRALLREHAATSPFDERVSEPRASLDGLLIACPESSGVVTVLESVSGTVVREWSTGLRGPMSLEFSWDGAVLAVSDGWSAHSKTLVMDLRSGHVAGPFEGEKADRGLSDDGAFLLVWSGKGLDVIDVTAGEVAWSVPGSLQGHHWLAPDASALVTSVLLGRTTEFHSRDQDWTSEIHVRRGRPLSGHDGWISELVASPSRDRLLTASVDGSARVWELEGAGSYLTLPELTGFDKGPSFAAAGGSVAPRVIGIAYDGVLRIWDSRTLEPLGETSLIRSGSFENGVVGTYCPEIESVALAAAGRLYVVDPILGRLISDTPIPVTDPMQVRFLDAARVEVSDASGAVVQVSISGTGAVTPLPSGAFRPPGGIVSPQGSFVAVARKTMMEMPALIKLYDARGRLLHELSGHSASVPGLQFTADEKRLISTSDDGTVRFWDTAAGEMLLRIRTSEFEGTDRLAFNQPGYVAEGTLLLPRRPDLSYGCLSLAKERDRHRWRRAEAEVRPAAAEWVRAARSERAWEVVVERALHAPELEGTLRHAVLNEITRQACGMAAASESKAKGG